MIKGATEVKGFLLSEASVAVYSAILLTPVVLGFTAKYVPSFAPAWVVLTVVAFVLFVASSKMKGYLGAILKGASIAMFLNAFLSTSLGGRLTSQLSSYTPTSG